MTAVNVSLFDVWSKGFAAATVSVYQAGTTTKSNLYIDEALTVSASNPQVLETKTINGESYGKFSAPLYTDSAFYLDINSTDQTGVSRPPLTSLASQDASAALITATGGSQPRTLSDVIARVVHVEDHGVFLPTSDPDASSSTNNATLTTAIGVAAANGGGDVVIPAGTFEFTTVTLSGGVRLVGHGHGATTLQSQSASNVITIGGSEAGLAHITIDGVNLQVGSVGLYAKAKDEIRIQASTIKRFVTGIHMQGGRKAEWYDLYISNCDTGAKLHGDNDASGGGDGDEFRNNAWTGGVVDLCTVAGVEFSYVDKKCWHNTIIDVGFESNTGVSININGARFTSLVGCWWTANTTDFAVADNSDVSAKSENTVIGLYFNGGSLSGGAATFTDTCQDVILDGMEISDVDFTLTLPTNNLVVRDCVEDSLVTISGDGTKWTRQRTINGNQPGSSGVTSDATPTKAWSVDLEPGQVGHIRAEVIANQRDGEGYAVYHIARPVRRPGSTLAYDAQTANFTVGDTLTGATGGATARIVADADGGASGTLTLRDIVGTFENNEEVTDGLGGSALVNGTLTPVNAALLGATASPTAAVESAVGLAADFAASGTEIEIQVTGEAAKTYEWIVHAETVID